MRAVRPLLLALVLVATLPLPATAAVRVRFAPETIVTGEQLVLGEIATVEGDEPGATRVRALRLGAAPAAGVVLRLDAAGVRQRFHDARIDPSRLQLSIPDRVTISRAHQVIPASVLVDAVRREALLRGGRGLPTEGPGALSLHPVQTPEDLRVAPGELSLGVALYDSAGGSSFLSATVRVRIDGRDVRSVPLSFRVGRYQHAVVASQSLDTAAPISAGSLRLEVRPSTELPQGALTDMPDASDLEAVRQIRAGDVVTAALVRRRLVVQKNQPVTLLLESRGFRITLQGKAIEDARRGDAVRVLNPTSRREVLGTAEGGGLVRVPFGIPGGE